jgi:hypothetical protein
VVGGPCAWLNSTVLTPPFDVVVPAGGKEATVTFELPAVADAGVWRTLAVAVDANCTNLQPPSSPPGLPSVQAAYYSTKKP